MENQVPTLHDWLNSNPGKTPNDYFLVFPHALSGHPGQSQPFLAQQPLQTTTNRSSSRSERTLWIVAIVLLAVIAIPFVVGYFDKQQKWQEAGLPASVTMSQREVEMARPESFIDIDVVEYKPRLLKTGELKMILRNQAKFVKYSNVVVHLKWLNKKGDVVKMDEGTFDRVLLPGDDEVFSMYDNSPLSSVEYSVDVISAYAEVYK